MSEVIYIEFQDDLPCNDWKGTPAEVKDCPCKKWRAGETVVCGECGHEIEYESETIETVEK